MPLQECRAEPLSEIGGGEGGCSLVSKACGSHSITRMALSQSEGAACLPEVPVGAYSSPPEPEGMEGVSSSCSRRHGGSFLP